jgi:hypothetical protein
MPASPVLPKTGTGLRSHTVDPQTIHANSTDRAGGLETVFAQLRPALPSKPDGNASQFAMESVSSTTDFARLNVALLRWRCTLSLYLQPGAKMREEYPGKSPFQG